MEIRPVNIPPPAVASQQAEEARAPAAPASGAAVAATPEHKSPGKEDLRQALQSINAVLQDRSPSLEFSFDSTTDRSVVKVVDKDTKEVIRQMPSREAIEIARALDKLQSLLIRDVA